MFRRGEANSTESFFRMVEALRGLWILRVRLREKPALRVEAMVEALRGLFILRLVPQAGHVGQESGSLPSVWDRVEG